MNTHLEMSFSIEKQILGFDVAMGNTLTVKILDSVEDLFEATFSLAWAHSPA
jgi:hypothetical protein